MPVPAPHPFLLPGLAATGAVVLAVASGVAGFQLGRGDRVPRTAAVQLEQRVAVLGSQSQQKDAENASLRAQVRDARAELDEAEDRIAEINLMQSRASATPAPSPAGPPPTRYLGRLTAAPAAGPDHPAPAGCVDLADRRLEVLDSAGQVLALPVVTPDPGAGGPATDGSGPRGCTWRYVVTTLPAAPVYTVRVVRRSGATATPDVSVTVPRAAVSGGALPDIVLTVEPGPAGSATRQVADRS